jgi:hypothetical protein
MGETEQSGPRQPVAVGVQKSFGDSDLRLVVCTLRPAPRCRLPSAVDGEPPSDLRDGPVCHVPALGSAADGATRRVLVTPSPALVEVRRPAELGISSQPSYTPHPC